MEHLTKALADSNERHATQCEGSHHSPRFDAAQSGQSSYAEMAAQFQSQVPVSGVIQLIMLPGR